MSPPYTCVPDGYLEPKIGESGVAAWKAVTVNQRFKVRFLYAAPADYFRSFLLYLV